MQSLDWYLQSEPASDPCYCQRVGVKNGLQSLALTERWIGVVDKRLLNALLLTIVKIKFRNRIGTAFRFVHVTCSTFLSAWSPSAHPELQRQVQARGSELTPAQGRFFFHRANGEHGRPFWFLWKIEIVCWKLFQVHVLCCKTTLQTVEIK